MVGDEAVERAGVDVEVVLALLEEEDDGELSVAAGLTGGEIFVEGSQDCQPVEARPDQMGAWPRDEVLRSDGRSLKAEEWEGEVAGDPRGGSPVLGGRGSGRRTSNSPSGRETANEELGATSQRQTRSFSPHGRKSETGSALLVLAPPAHLRQPWRSFCS